MPQEGNYTSWETINLNEIEQTKAVAAPPPEGDYTLRLIGVAPDKYDATKLAFDMVIAEGNYAKRRLFPTLPTPETTKDWPAQAAAKFLSVLGIEQNPGETILEVFNRAAGNGHSTFIGAVKHYTKTNGDVKLDLNWFSVRPATS